MKKVFLFLLIAFLLLSSCQKSVEAESKETEQSEEITEASLTEDIEAELERLDEVINGTDMRPSYAE